MSRPRLLDMFCCAGGAAMGYHRAGFDVVGVDIKPRPHYPFEFIQADCMSLESGFVASFDAAHASPPCQGYTALRHAPGTKGAPKLIEQTRALLVAAGIPYVIENVEGAPLIDAVTLCGSMFGSELEAHFHGETIGYLRRHREFECSFPLSQPVCRHADYEPVIGVYGGHARLRSKAHGGRGTRDLWPEGHKRTAQMVMGIHWMTLAEMSEAIPPAYTRFIGKQLLAQIEARALAA